MAASAYAALASITHVLEQIQHPARHRLRYDRSQIETLHEMVRFMLDFFEAHPTAVYDTDEEDWINLVKDLQIKLIERVLHKFKTLKEVFAESREKKRSSQEQQPSVSLPAAAGSSTPPAPSGKNTMVGFNDHVARIKDRLTAGESRLQVVPIVGMGGIGKTTLAQSIFHDPCFKNHFDIRIWFTISQEYRVSDILLSLLGEKKEGYSLNIAELGQKLYQKLFGQRYLIVLDDVWSVDVWDDLKLYFPETNEGSRIIVTTRLSSISDSLGNENSYSVDLLNDEKSWELLSQKAFGKVGCLDHKFEEIGRRIASNCKGLPLAIVVIGGLLSKSDVTLEKWEEVGKNVTSIVNSEDDELCMKILSLSYKHLPIHLKPCFLYMRVYPEDYNIRVPQLIQSWIGEGFVISKGGKTLEEVAGEYLKNLIDRNLILTEFHYTGEMKKNIGIHDLLRDLCIRENQRENTFRIPKVYVDTLMEDFGKRNNICWLCGERDVCASNDFPSLFHDSWYTYLETMRHECKESCLAAALSVRHLQFTYGYYHYDGTWLHLFWNLRSIFFHSTESAKIHLPSEIWNMPQLRHVKFNNAILPEPPVNPIDSKDSIILEGLETLGTLVCFSCSEEILAGIPNVKNLKIEYEGDGSRWCFKYPNLTRLHKLESLTITWIYFYVDFPGYIKEFPRSLKKLKLVRCELSWEDMTIIGSLPNLEVLKLYRVSFEGNSWDPVDGELIIYYNYNDLVTWNAEKEHFPKLEFLVLRWMKSLKNFPSGIGEIDTLLSITLYDCPDELVNSAKEVVAEQRTYGNEGLQLHVKE